VSSRIVRWTDADGDLDSFARRLCADHPGDVLDVDQPDLVAALTAHGGDLVRRSVLMGRDLRPLPPDRTGGADDGSRVTVAPMVPDPERYAGAMLRAFPPHHVDYDPDIPDEDGARRALASYFAGEIIGPFLAEGSREAVVGGAVAGGLVVSDRPASDGQDPGPWVTDAFVDPAFQGQGIGWALFGSAIDGLRQAGHETIGLAVHADNPAQHLYRRLGFVERSRWARIAI
jgi:GNAT superfamily N-acetyltransferase